MDIFQIFVLEDSVSCCFSRKMAGYAVNKLKNIRNTKSDEYWYSFTKNFLLWKGIPVSIWLELNDLTLTAGKNIDRIVKETKINHEHVRWEIFNKK